MITNNAELLDVSINRDIELLAPPDRGPEAQRRPTWSLLCAANFWSMVNLPPPSPHLMSKTGSK